ncbi:hypothetical protein ACKLNR_001445 [Fusarium oxysporum f. sp. zingiberi]
MYYEKISDNILDGLNHLAGNIHFIEGWVSQGILINDTVHQAINPVPYLAAFYNQTGWIQKHLKNSPPASPTTGLPTQSLLSSAVMGTAEDTVQKLLELGYKIEEHLNHGKGRPPIRICDTLAYQVMAEACHWWTVTLDGFNRDAMAHILEVFLRNGMDPTYIFLVEGFKEADEKWMRFATLRDAVAMMRLKNMETLETYLPTVEQGVFKDGMSTHRELQGLLQIEVGVEGADRGFIEGMFLGTTKFPKEFITRLY